MDFGVPIGLGCLVFGLPNIHVGWSNLRGRGTPREFLSNPILLYVFAPERFPRQLRSRSWFEGAMQVGFGLAFALVGAVLVATGFARAVA
jgi:hypothetical protein